LADHFAFKFYGLNFAQNHDRALAIDLQAARRPAVPLSLPYSALVLLLTPLVFPF